MKKSIGCIVVALLGFVVLVGAVLAGGLLFGRAQEPDFITITVESPAVVPANVPFEIQLSIRNIASKEIVLHSVDVSTSYLDMFEVSKISPEPTGEQTIPFVGFRSYALGQTIFAGGRQLVVLEVVGQENGRFTGEFDVCVESATLCKLVVVETVIGAGNGR